MKTKSGKKLHPIGIGTWGINSIINPTHKDHKYRGVEPLKGDEQKGIDAIRYSASKGQNHIDCAELYGGFYTDEVIGQAIKTLNREDLYIADKLWKTSVGSGLVRKTVEEMLAKLNTDYLDMLYIHAPFDDAPWQEAIPQIDKLIKEGVVRDFGVSNFTVAQMKEANRLAEHPITANQINFNVLHKEELDQAFHAYCKENNIQIVAYQPIKRKEVLSNDIINKIARAHDSTPAQVSLAWLLSKDALPIPKAIQKSHIDDNIKSIGLALTKEDIEELDLL